jgi:hypothetical protein
MKGSKVLLLALFWAFYLYAAWQSYSFYQIEGIIGGTWFSIFLVVFLVDGIIAGINFSILTENFPNDEKIRVEYFKHTFPAPATTILLGIALAIQAVGRVADEFLSI